MRIQIEKVRRKRELTEKKIRQMMFRRSETQLALEKVQEEIKVHACSLHAMFSNFPTVANIVYYGLSLKVIPVL